MPNNNSLASQGERIVKNHMLASLAVGLVPIPFADLAALTGIQIKMLRDLAKLYRVEFHEERSRSVISSLIGGGVPVSLAFNFGSFAKFISPAHGLIVGAFGTSLFGGASTYAMGKVFIQHFESGRTLLEFDPAKVRDYYAEQLKNGQTEVRKTFSGTKP